MERKLVQEFRGIYLWGKPCISFQFRCSCGQKLELFASTIPPLGKRAWFRKVKIDDIVIKEKGG